MIFWFLFVIDTALGRALLACQENLGMYLQTRCYKACLLKVQITENRVCCSLPFLSASFHLTYYNLITAGELLRTPLPPAVLGVLNALAVSNPIVV